MGLLVEILNYHSKDLLGFNKNPLFRVDIDDCVISGHPNLISTDGASVLIPNAMSPKYFFGNYGYAKNPAKEITNKRIIGSRPTAVLTMVPKYEYETTLSEEYKDKLSVTDEVISFDGFDELTKDIAEANAQLSDYRLMKVCISNNAGVGVKAFRDDLNVIINQARLSRKLKGPFEFPFKSDHPSGIPGATELYPAKYSGYLKNIYFNIGALTDIMKDSSVKTFTHVLEKVLQRISDCCGNFFDLKWVAATGRSGEDTGVAASMKIIDYRFVYSINKGKVFSFDYYDADSILQNIKFTPTLSNSQAIRTIYAETNNPNRNIVFSDNNELLNYHFRDRLFLDEQVTSQTIKTSKSFVEMMKSLQSLTPTKVNGKQVYQVTTKKPNGKVIIKRLAMPSDELLKLLLDDGDEERNPKYIGIMPGIQAQFTIQGIGGLRTFMMFLVRNLPEPYSHKNIVFRIIDLTENLESGKWSTTITAGIIPLRNVLKRRLGIIGE
jgi:hypothetical protein